MGDLTNAYLLTKRHKTRLFCQAAQNRWKNLQSFDYFLCKTKPISKKPK